MRRCEYLAITALGPRALQEKVQRALDEGYAPHGSVICYKYGQFPLEESRFCQPVVRWVQEDGV